MDSDAVGDVPRQRPFLRLTINKGIIRSYYSNNSYYIVRRIDDSVFRTPPCSVAQAIVPCIIVPGFEKTVMLCFQINASKILFQNINTPKC